MTGKIERAALLAGGIERVARADFANGLSFVIQRNLKISKTACEVLDMQTGSTHPAHTVSKAWAHIRYMGKVQPASQNTTGWMDFEF